MKFLEEQIVSVVTIFEKYDNNEKLLYKQLVKSGIIKAVHNDDENIEEYKKCARTLLDLILLCKKIYDDRIVIQSGGAARAGGGGEGGGTRTGGGGGTRTGGSELDELKKVIKYNAFIRSNRKLLR